MRGSSTWLRKKGEGMAVILTGGKRGWRLGTERREERRGEVRWSPRVCSTFIGVREGHARDRKGEMASGNGLNAIEGGAA
jgi:hypothetical protein